MTRLIVEEGGQRRGFKVGDGLLTVGSGAGAKLKLTSEGIAEIHVELGVEGGRVMLRPRPGVVAPKIKGVPVKGPVELGHQVVVQIGAARISVEYPEAPARSAARPAAPVARAGKSSGAKGQGGGRRGARPARAGARSGAKGSGRSGRRSARDDEDEGPRRYQGKRSNTPWVTLAIFAGAVAALGLFVVVMGPRLLGEAPPIFEPALHINRAEEYVEAADYVKALEELDRIPTGEVVISAELQKRIDGLRASIEAGRARRELTQHNMRGNPYLQTQLKNFEKNYLQGKPDRPKVRVFLKRLDYFAAKWPQHPDIDWVVRMRERYAGVIDTSVPPDFDDIAFEVETLTWADPRDFKQAFAVLDEFIASASADDRAKALELYDEKLKHRDEWFNDKLQQARWEYEREELGKSLAWLVKIVVYTGDEVMAETAAQEIVKFPRLQERLRGYRNQSLERWEVLSAQPTIRAWLRENPLDG